MLEINDLKFSYNEVFNKTNKTKKPEKGRNTNNLEMCFNLQVKAGEILSIIGASGSGKSTLLNLIAGFNKPKSGEIFVNKNDISKLAIAERPVTTVFQEHNLFPHLDVFTNVAIGVNPSLKLNKNDKEMIKNALESVGLGDLLKRLPSKLSGGQRQRVALARALVRKHEILLLDEPLAALGPSMREEIITLIKDMVEKEKMAALFVSHQPSDALLASKYCAFIHKGEVLKLDETQKLLTSSNHDEVKEYLGV